MVCLCSFTLASLGFAILFVAYQVYRFTLKPYLALKFYKNQGLEVKFIPLLGFFKGFFEDLNNHGDILYSWKEKNFQNPKPKAFASNFGDRPHLALKDPELIKQFYVN